MQKRRLGSLPIDVSILGLGTVKFGRNTGVKYPAPFDLPSDVALEELLAVAKDCGINLLDTAPAYGASEERLGKLLRGQREQWVLSTKVGETFVEGVSHFDFSRETVVKSVECSLQRLRTDYLDVVLVHSNGEDERIIREDGVFDTLSRLKEAGKLRAFGMSTKTMAGGKLTLEMADVAMIAFHPGYTDERELLDDAARLGKGVFVKKALASGHLPPSKALTFVLQQPGVTSVIVGTIDVSHLRENALYCLNSH